MKPLVADYKTAVKCLRVVTQSGSTVRLTDFPRDLTMSNGQVYRTGSGYQFTGYAAESAMAAGVVDLEGILGALGVDRDALASGVFDNARAYLFATSYQAPIEDEEPITASILGKTVLLDGRYKIEDMALVDCLGQTVGDTYAAACKKRFGGQEFGGCGVDLAAITVTGTITGVTSGIILRDAARTEPADWFAQGTIIFTSGANAGLGAMQLRDYAADGTITLYEAPYYPVQAGDAYSMVPGCRHRRLEDCRDKWSNVARFGGFPWVPTGSAYAKVGGSNAG